MIRARMFRRASPEAPFEYRNTAFLDNNDLNDAGKKLVEKWDVVVGDLVYMGDFYLLLLSTEPEPKWQTLHPERPEVHHG